MDIIVFMENLKRFRNEKSLTQEQVAEALCVNSQTVSRWECGTTLPDVLTLPEIARLYGVTVDDLYKKHSKAYDNYAQRLSSVYEKTRDVEDFVNCRFEYQKLIKLGEFSQCDKWNYATIHHFMARFCKDIALEWYDKTIADGCEKDEHIYMRARSMKNSLMFELGRGAEVINDEIKILSEDPNNAREWCLLCEAYIWDYNYKEAFSTFERGIERFPEAWLLYIHGGEALEGLKRYDEALACYDKAGELGTYFFDELYCKASCLSDMGEHDKARSVYLKHIEKLRAMGYDVEADMAEREVVRLERRTK